MNNFLQQINSYIKEAFNAGKYLYNGLSVTFDHLRRRPVTVQYPYEKLIDRMNIPCPKWKSIEDFKNLTDEEINNWNFPMDCFKQYSANWPSYERIRIK